MAQFAESDWIADMESATCPIDVHRSRGESQEGVCQPCTHPLADELADVLQEALPHASTFVRFTDPLTGSQHAASRAAECHMECPALREHILSWQEDSSRAPEEITEMNNGAEVNFAAVPIESPLPNVDSGFLAAFSREQDFPTPRDRAVLRMAAVAAQNALNRLVFAEGDDDSEASQDVELQHLLNERENNMAMPHRGSRRSEYMAALGTLAAGLSHDLGNLLLPIRLRLATIETRMDDNRFAQDFGAIRSCLDSMQRLTHGLELFALDPDQAAASDGNLLLHDWWSDVEPFLRNALPNGVVLVADIPDDLPRIRIARHLLAQVILNLVQNAGEALQPRGHGRVGIWARTGEDGDTVVLCVADDGPGMSEEVCARCFEPFFTTKTRAISTGLGLSLVHGIVKRAGGSIRVQSHPGNGTSMHLELPAVSQPRSSRITAAARTATVNISDARLHGFVTTFLQALGLEVRTTSGPPCSESVLWATDDVELVRHDAKAFLNCSDRCVVVLGSIDGAADDPRIHSLGCNPDRAGLSRALRQCAQLVNGARATAEQTTFCAKGRPYQ